MFYVKFAFVSSLVILHIPADLSAIEGKREKHHGSDEKTPLLQLQEDNGASQGVSWQRRTAHCKHIITMTSHESSVVSNH